MFPFQFFNIPLKEMIYYILFVEYPSQQRGFGTHSRAFINFIFCANIESQADNGVKYWKFSIHVDLTWRLSITRERYITF